MEKLSEQELVRREKLDVLKDLNIDPFGQRFDRNNTTKTLKEKFDVYSKEELHDMETEKVKVAGRIMTKRGKGKAGFAHIMDQNGQVQLYVRLDAVGQESFDLFNKADLGDIIGVEGKVMKTNTGELSIRVETYTHLSKSLRPLPEKFHGLKDIEERYRRRYVDLTVNDHVKETFIKRTFSP